MDKILTEITLNQAAKIIIRVRDYKNRNYLDMRSYFLTETNEWVPTKKGVSIPLQHLATVKKAVDEAVELFPPESK